MQELSVSRFAEFFLDLFPIVDAWLESAATDVALEDAAKQLISSVSQQQGDSKMGADISILTDLLTAAASAHPPSPPNDRRRQVREDKREKNKGR